MLDSLDSLQDLRSRSLFLLWSAFLRATHRRYVKMMRVTHGTRWTNITRNLAIVNQYFYWIVGNKIGLPEKYKEVVVDAKVLPDGFKSHITMMHLVRLFKI